MIHDPLYMHFRLMWEVGDEILKKERKREKKREDIGDDKRGRNREDW